MGLWVRLRLETRWNTLSVKARYRHDLGVLREKLKDILARPDPFVIGDAEHSDGQVSTELAAVLEGVPLDLWAEELGEGTDLLASLLAFKETRRRFVRAARALDIVLMNEIRAHHASLHIYAPNDGILLRFVASRLRSDIDIDTLLSWLIGQTNEEARHSFLTRWEWVSAQPSVQSSLPEYLESLSSLQQCINSLRELLDVLPSQPELPRGEDPVNSEGR